MKHIKAYGQLNEAKSDPKLSAGLEQVLSLLKKKSKDFKAVYKHADDFYIDSEIKHVSVEYVFSDVDDDDRETEDIVKVMISMNGSKYVISIENERFVDGDGDDIATDVKPKTANTPEDAVATGMLMIKSYKSRADGIPEAPIFKKKKTK